MSLKELEANTPQDRRGLGPALFAMIVALLFALPGEALDAVKCRAGLAAGPGPVSEIIAWSRSVGASARDLARIEADLERYLRAEPEGAALLTDYLAVRRETYARKFIFDEIGEKDLEWSSRAAFERSRMRDGSLDAIAMLLRDSVGDPGVRLYARKILEKMKRELDQRDVLWTDGKPRRVPDNYALLFRFAKAELDGELAAKPIPTGLASDFRLFTVRAQVVKPGSGVYENPKLIERIASYDPLQESLVWREKIDRHFDEGATSWTQRGVKSSVDRYIEAFFDWYEGRGTLPKEDIAILRFKERALPKKRANYFVYTDARTGEMQSMIRLYDANPMYQKLGESGRISRVGFEETFIEEDFPFLVLPERRLGIPIFELGRLGVDREKVLDGVLPTLARVAEWLEAENKTGVIYLDALEGAAELYVRRYGATVAYTPEALETLKRLTQGRPVKESRWARLRLNGRPVGELEAERPPRVSQRVTILKFTVEDFIARFKKDYSVPKRRGE